MFDSLVDFLKTNIDELNGHEVQISSEFKEHHNEDSKYIMDVQRQNEMVSFDLFVVRPVLQSVLVLIGLVVL